MLRIYCFAIINTIVLKFIIFIYIIQMVNYRRKNANAPSNAFKAKRNMRPRKNVIKGRGFYKGFLSDVGRLAGGGLGRVFGKSDWRDKGDKLGKMVSNITGFGGYNTNNNNGNNILPANPVIRNLANMEDAIVIRHREYIGDVVSSTGFEVQYELPLQPGLDTSFPWLSSIANSFQQYSFVGCIYEFVSTCGSAIASTNNSLGSVMMTCQYDSLETTVSNKQTMLNDNFASSFAPSSNGMLAIECDEKQSTLTKLYTRPGTITSGDLRLYDLGKVVVSTQGQQAADITLGSLYVNYEVVLLKPQLLNPGVAQDVAAYSLNGVVSASTFGTSQTEIYDNIGCTFTANKITFDKNNNGHYMISYFVYGASSANVVAPVQGALVNCTAFTVGSLSQWYAPSSPATAVEVQNTMFIKITDPTIESSVTYTTGTIPGTVAYATVVVSQINPKID